MARKTLAQPEPAGPAGTIVMDLDNGRRACLGPRLFMATRSLIASARPLVPDSDVIQDPEWNELALMELRLRGEMRVRRDDMVVLLHRKTKRACRREGAWIESIRTRVLEIKAGRPRTFHLSV